MAISAPRVVTLPEARVLADLVGVEQDLKATIAFCERIRDQWLKPESADWVTLDALSTAAVVRYCRCFVTGVRERFDFGVIEQDLQELHTWIRALRDKHVAHSVNDYERNAVTVHVVEPPDPPVVQEIGFLSGRLGGLSPEIAGWLIELCQTLLGKVKLDIEERKRHLREAVHSLPVTEVYSFPEPDPVSTDWEKVGASRKRH